MMQATKHGKRDDLSTRSGRVRRWCSGNPLAESLVRPASVEEGDVLAEHGPEMLLSENDDVVQALAPYASEEALTHRIHQRGPDGGLHDANAGTAQLPIMWTGLRCYAAYITSMRSSVLVAADGFASSPRSPNSR